MHPNYDCPRISFELKEDGKFLCLGEIVIFACVVKHALHSPIFEGLPFYLDILESINHFNISRFEKKFILYILQDISKLIFDEIISKLEKCGKKNIYQTVD